VRGGCRPEVATIVRGSSDCGQISFAVVDGVLYWTNELRGTVEGIGVDGSSRRTITSGEASPGAIAVIGSNLFWSAMGSEVTAADGGIAGRRLALRHMTLPDGAPADAAVEVGQAPGIRSLVASDDGRVLYYAFDNHVRAWPVAGGAATEVVEELSGDALSALAIDGTSFAGTTFAYLVAGRIELTPLVDRDVAMCDWRTRRAIGSPSCVLVEDGPEVLPALVLKSGRVYWSSGTTVAFTATTARVPAGAVGRIASSQSGTRVVGLFGGPDALYFVGGDVVERASYLPGFEAIPLARGQTPTGALAVDGSRVYWVNADCSIAAVPLD
jgi:hypothetical protein